MEDRVLEDKSWTIEYTQEDLRPIAVSVADTLRNAGATETKPVYKRPGEATLGTPEIIITIVVTAAAKALIVAGLHALEKTLQDQIDRKTERRAQVILAGKNKPKRRFPISLASISKEAVKDFISQIVSAVNAV